MPTDPTFTAEDALTTTRTLRDALGLGQERFPAAAFIGMVSDEIEQLRAAGQDDTAIAALIAEATGKPVTAELIQTHYTSPENRTYGAE